VKKAPGSNVTEAVAQFLKEVPFVPGTLNLPVLLVHQDYERALMHYMLFRPSSPQLQFQAS